MHPHNEIRKPARLKIRARRIIEFGMDYRRIITMEPAKMGDKLCMAHVRDLGLKSAPGPQV
jgi:hypothetical protein